MSSSQNLQRPIEDLIQALEMRREAGLLPAHVWRSGPSPAPAAQESPMPTSPTPSEKIDPAEALKVLREKIGDCTRCRLHQGRTHLVFGVGNAGAELMFVGEGPGRDEDLKGEPFVGRAGQLLTKIIEAMGLKRSDVYIANVVKCRPPENRNPAPDEIETCSPFLMEQIEKVRPKIIVGLGNFAVQTILGTQQTITGLRGRFHRWPSLTVKATLHTTLPTESILLMPTYHPAYLLRNPNMKKPVWEDMKMVMKELEKTSSK